MKVGFGEIDDGGFSSAFLSVVSTEECENVLLVFHLMMMMML